MPIKKWKHVVYTEFKDAVWHSGIPIGVVAKRSGLHGTTLSRYLNNTKMFTKTPLITKRLENVAQVVGFEGEIFMPYEQIEQNLKRL